MMRRACPEDELIGRTSSKRPPSAASCRRGEPPCDGLPHLPLQQPLFASSAAWRSLLHFLPPWCCVSCCSELRGPKPQRGHSRAGCEGLPVGPGGAFTEGTVPPAPGRAFAEATPPELLAAPPEDPRELAPVLAEAPTLGATGAEDLAVAGGAPAAGAEDFAVA